MDALKEGKSLHFLNLAQSQQANQLTHCHAGINSTKKSLKSGSSRS
jgi:hypothetical protein